tara:strand:+ start:175 stop:423 length:249 start_codon:yes stop_codon:yes gene_type:complete
MAQTQKQRLALIRKVSKKFNKKLQRNQRVRKTETVSYLPYGYPASKGYDDVNINHWTDAPKYLDEHYGDRMREQNEYERDWD